MWGGKCIDILESVLKKIVYVHEEKNLIFAHMSVKAWGGDKGLSGHVRQECKLLLEGSPYHLLWY